MRRIPGGMGDLVLVGILAWVCCSCASADASLQEELATLRARLAAMESVQACDPAEGESATRDLTSMKKNARVRIGGKAETAVLVVHGDDNPRADNGEGDTIDSTSFTHAAALTMNVYASKDVYLHFKLDLDDFKDAETDQDDLLEECFFKWKNIGGTEWNFLLGKNEVKAFGQDYDIGYMDAMTHGEANLFDWWSETDDDGNPHEGVGTNTFPGELDNAFQVEASYKWNDLLKIRAAVFQDPKSRGMHEDRSDDTLLFQSYAAKIEFTPVEALEMELSGIRRHNDSETDAPDQSAISFGVTFKPCSLPVEFFGEYLHGWDVDWREDMDTDMVQLGFSWDVTDQWCFSAMGEWAQIENGKKYDEEDYYSVYMTLYYTMDCGVYCGLEFMQQWFEGESTAGETLDADASMLGFVTGFSF